VNAVRRMVARHGRLLEPAEMKSSKEPNDFTPEAQFRYRRELEPPRTEEGFSEIENVPFILREERRTGKAIFLSELGSTHVLKRYVEDDYRVIQLEFHPGSSETEIRVDVEGVDIEVLVCTHQPGPAVCWCRKPLPGLGVLSIEKYGLDPGECIVVGDSPADRGFAERLGFQLVPPKEFFGEGRTPVF